MAIATFDDLFLHTLKDIYYAEKALVRALPKMAKKSVNADLRKAFQTHLEETKGHVQRLERVFEKLGSKARGVKCEAIDGLIAEAQETMAEIGEDHVRDAAMISAGQAVEHYEISRYGTLVAWARQMDHDEIAAILQQTLDEEHKTDALLNELAEDAVNMEAEEAGEDEDMDEERAQQRGGRRKAA